MSAPLTNTALSDPRLYDGRTPLGFIRTALGGVFAYESDGRSVGSCADQKAAQVGLRDHVAGKAGRHDR